MGLIMKGKALLLSALMILIIFSPGCLGGDEVDSRESVPTFSLTADDGDTYSSDNLLGEAYILHFSASWCNNCRPTMHVVSNHLNDSMYIVVSTDGSDSQKLSDWHLQVNDSKEDSLVDAPFTVGVTLSGAFEINNTPTLILIDEDGFIVDRYIGPLTDTDEIDSFWTQLE
jgi:thiol-disulfide isomerase/thioredoxin